MIWSITIVNKYKTDINTLTTAGNTMIINIMQASGSPLGNPFYKSPVSRERRIASFNEFFNKEIMREDSALKKEMDRLFGILKRTGKLYLVCCCKPLPCHGDIIKKSLDEAMLKLVKQQLFIGGY